MGGEGSLLLSLAELLFRWVLEDEGVEAMKHVDLRYKSTSLADQLNVLSLDLHNCLWVVAVVALNILLDEVL